MWTTEIIHHENAVVAMEHDFGNNIRVYVNFPENSVTRIHGHIIVDTFPINGIGIEQYANYLNNIEKEIQTILTTLSHDIRPKH